METLSLRAIKILIGILAIFCLLSGRAELGVLFLIIGILIPVARNFAHFLDVSALRSRPENQ